MKKIFKISLLLISIILVGLWTCGDAFAQRGKGGGGGGSRGGGGGESVAEEA